MSVFTRQRLSLDRYTTTVVDYCNPYVNAAGNEVEALAGVEVLLHELLSCGVGVVVVAAAGEMMVKTEGELDGGLVRDGAVGMGFDALEGRVC